MGIKIALRGGALKKGVYVGKWEPYCDDPVRIDRMITSREAVDDLKPMEVSFKAPCRKCAKCLQFRQMRWRERAMTEVSRAKRTWFGTLTFSPIHLAGILLEAKSGDLKKVERAAYRHVQKFFKRLRKNGHVFRYLAVYERGEITGRSHYHLLLHEVDKPIHKTQLDDLWRSFTYWRLIGGHEDGSCTAGYVTKYTTKHFDIRPRASARYGKPTVPSSAARPKKVEISRISGSTTDDAPTNDGDLASQQKGTSI